MNRQSAPLAHSVRVFVPGPGEHFTLPSEVTKAGAIATIAAAMILMKAKPIEVLVFRQIADRTERVAWHSGERAPVNWRRQCDMAREAGISERHFRRIEARLVQMGVLARATADNGYRGRRAGQPWNSPVQCGLSLEPAIANYAAFVAMVAAADAIEDQRQEVLFNIRTARQRVRALAAAASDFETRRWAGDAIEDLCGDLPSEVLRGVELDPLLAHHTAILDLEDLIREASTPLPHPEAAPPSPDVPPDVSSGTGASTGECDAKDESAETLAPKAAADMSGPSPSGPAGDADPARGERPALLASVPAAEPAPVENTRKKVMESSNMSGAPDSGVRSLIQPQENLIESCNDQSSSITPPARAGEPVSSPSQPHGRDDCYEQNDRTPEAWVNPAILQRLNTVGLRDLASEDAALYLDAVEDWRDCLPYLLRELGVNVSAWTEACDVMGDQVAFIALLVIDRNRFHPVTPVHSPGGALRAFTDRARRGELNLTRAILGIWERDRQGKQPKAAPKVMQ